MSPPHTKFTQELNIAVHRPEWEAAFKIEKLKAVKHIEFSMRIAKLQMSRGAYFPFEHPARASTWELPAIIEVQKSEGVDTVNGDQCMYGLTTPNAGRTAIAPAKKLTSFMGNSPLILAELCLRCDKSHDNQAFMGGGQSE